MTTETPQPRGVVAWMEVLERIQALLGESLQLANITPPTPPPADSPTQKPLEGLTTRLAQLQECLDRADRNAGEMDRLLGADAEAVRHWLESVQAVREKLERWESRTV